MNVVVTQLLSMVLDAIRMHPWQPPIPAADPWQCDTCSQVIATHKEQPGNESTGSRGVEAGPSEARTCSPGRMCGLARCAAATPARRC